LRNELAEGAYSKPSSKWRWFRPRIVISVKKESEMDAPVLYKIKTESVKDHGKALIFIPGMLSEEKEIGGKYTNAIISAGWDGGIYYLWWMLQNPSQWKMLL
jgi:hypothetical protein